jgi:hypothetical protein
MKERERERDGEVKEKMEFLSGKKLGLVRSISLRRRHKFLFSFDFIISLSLIRYTDHHYFPYETPLYLR